MLGHTRRQRYLIPFILFGLVTCEDQAVDVVPTGPLSIAQIPDLEVEVNSTHTLDMAQFITDPGGVLNYQISNSDPSVAKVDRLDSHLNITGVASGIASVVVTARNTASVAVQQSFSVVVPNRAPTLQPIPDQTLVLNEELYLDMIPYAEDPDGDRLAYRAVGTPDSVVVAVAIGNDIHLQAKSRGSALVSIWARDSHGLTTESAFDAIVRNQSPELVKAMPQLTLPTGDAMELDVKPYFSDPEGDPLTFDVVSIGRSEDDPTVEVSVHDGIVTVVGLARGAASIDVAASDGSMSAAGILLVEVVNASPKALSMDGMAVRNLSTSLRHVADSV